MQMPIKVAIQPAHPPPLHAMASSSLLQRKCACGSPIASLTDACPECTYRKPLQKKLAIGASSHPLEREADRVAERVLAEPADPALSEAAPSIHRFGEKSVEQSDAGHESVSLALAEPGSPLGPTLRQDMEQRFGHDFSHVRVHTGAVADRSAKDVHAQAYTSGPHVVFSAGRFAPATYQGRRLLAHELTHVTQQSGGVSLPIQRQPEETPPKEDATAKKPAKTTLKSEGVGLSDPVAGNTAAIIDQVLARNQKLAPYISDRLKAGFSIAEKGKFVHASSHGNFDNAYRKAYDMKSSETVSKDTTGFFDPKKSEVHLRPNAKFGTALHESMHRLASPALYGSYLQEAMKISTNLTEVLKEGVTAFFTDAVLNDEGLPNFNDAYRSKKKKAENLIAALGSDGFDLIAKFNFQGGAVVEIGEKLGFTSKQFSASQGRGIREVLKRMEKAL